MSVKKKKKWVLKRQEAQEEKHMRSLKDHFSDVSKLSEICLANERHLGGFTG